MLGLIGRYTCLTGFLLVWMQWSIHEMEDIGEIAKEELHI